MNKSCQPPRLLLRFFRWFCHPEYVEDIEGDLLERFEKRRQEEGLRRAKWLFLKEVVLLFRPGIITSVIPKTPLMQSFLLVHFLKVAYRNLLKNKTYSVINISGLIIGMAAALILFKYVGFVVNYDQFHELKDRIVLIHHEETNNGHIINNGDKTYWQTGVTAKERYPEVLRASHYDFNVETHVSAKREDGTLAKFNERNMRTVDPDFPAMFSFRFISGDPATALLQPNSVVITQSIAQKYFYNEEALGQTFTTNLPWGEEHVLKVTGIIEDVPVYSRFQFDFLKTSVGITPEDRWEYATHTTYLLLDDQTDPAELSAKMTADFNNLEAFVSGLKKVDFTLVPLSKVRLPGTEILLVLIGVFLLIITWINFVNLTSAKSLSRLKEVGIRKMIGSEKREIIYQFVVEGISINIFSLFISVSIVSILYPAISAYTNHQVLPLFHDPSGINWVFLGTFFFGSIVSSSYPAIVLSALHSIRSIHGQLGQVRGVVMRKTLTVAQFSISIILMIGIFIISDQMTFMKNKDLGLNLGQTLIVRTAKDQWSGKAERLRAFKKEVANLATTKDITSSTSVPGEGYGQEINFRIEGSDKVARSHLIGVGADYMSFYEAKLLAGEDFSKDRSWSNRKSILINKSTTFEMGCDSPEEAVGQKITNPKNGITYTVLGVVDDFHHSSPKEKIPPMTFDFNPFRGHTSIKINTSTYSRVEDLKRSIAVIENVWNDIYPDQTFDYYFLDQQFNSQYQSDIRFMEIFGVFTGISIFVACLGLFGLAIFITQKKSKEVGIRKVFGASAFQIVALFLRGHFVQIFWSMAIGIPTAWFLMNLWLENYSYRISINAWQLIIPSMLIVVLSLTTIGFHSLKMALINPSNTLRDE